MVGNGDWRKLGTRDCWSVGCAGGKWPAVCYRGRIIRSYQDSRGNVIASSQRIAGGQSGGALFDADSGYLIGLTNWGSGRTTEALFTSSWVNNLTAILKQ